MCFNPPDGAQKTQGGEIPGCIKSSPRRTGGGRARMDGKRVVASRPGRAGAHSRLAGRPRRSRRRRRQPARHCGERRGSSVYPVSGTVRHPRFSAVRLAVGHDHLLFPRIPDSVDAFRPGRRPACRFCISFRWRSPSFRRAAGFWSAIGCLAPLRRAPPLFCWRTPRRC